MMKMKSNHYTDFERLDMIAHRIFESGVDLTSDYDSWVKVTFACASLGEEGREPYHLICSVYPDYSREECDEKFNNCLTSKNGSISLGTLWKMAQDAGVDTNMPRGRRPKTEKESEEEQKNRMQIMREQLNAYAEWRYNVWRQRPEFREKDGTWQQIQDRDVATYYCRLKEQGITVRESDVRAMIFSRDFCKDFDAIKSWLLSLKPWNPDTAPDYLHDFYVGHLEFEDPENEVFYDQMLKKWHVGLVALMLGQGKENPLMPILKGPQHTGKTYFARHILPPEVNEYRLDKSPSEPIDKDFIISMSESPLIVCDEVSFTSNAKNDAFKHMITLNKSNLRDAYAHFRVDRERRASFFATTNEEYIIRESEGSRRFLVIDLRGTVDLDNFPLPYEGAYAQAIYLLEHGFSFKPNQEDSQMITQHNENFMMADDCEEAIKTFLKLPDGLGPVTTMSAGDIKRELNSLGFHGKEFNSVSIGKAMKRLKFEQKVVKKTRKYLVTKIDTDMRMQENQSDTKEFIPEVF